MANISVTAGTSQELYNVLQEKLKNKQTKNSELNNKETELTNKNQDIETKSEAQNLAEQKLSETSQIVSSLTQNYNSIYQQWNIANSQLSSLAAKLAESENDENLQAQYESAKETLKKIEDNLKDTDSKLQAAKIEQENAQDELEKANAELKQAELEQKELTNQLETLKKELDTLEDEIKDTQSEYNIAKAKETQETEAAQNSSRITEEEALQEGYTIVKTAEDLKSISQNPSGKYILMNDIDLSGIDWVPLCQGLKKDGSDIFRGILDGNGYSIKNLNIKVDEGADTENVGFFGKTEDAAITNINFENAQIQTPETYTKGSVGIIAGTASGTSFENITVSGDLTGHQKVGGLVGTISDYGVLLNNQVALHNSSFKNINSNVNINSSYYAGALAGYINSTYSNDLVIENCNASGSITVQEKCAGGFIGESGDTIITINKSTSSVNLSCPNTEDPRVGGFVGCIDGSKIAMCNSQYNGNIDAQGDFQGEYYGYYKNDARVAIFELSAGLPVDDILNIDGIEGLTPVIDKETGEAHYEAAVSTLNGLDKIVALVRNNPQLADILSFNVLFDFEAMDKAYDQSNYSQYGVVQHLYEETDAEGNTVVVNDVYIDNEIDLETTFHEENCCKADVIKHPQYQKTMVSGLWKDDSGNYYVERLGEFIKTTLEFFFEHQRTSITKRLDTDEVRFRERLTAMVSFYQAQMYASLYEKYGFSADYIPNKIDEPEYNYLKQRLENGEELSKEEALALEIYELDYKIIDLVAETTHNEGCGMGGNASFLERTDAIPLKDEDGRIRYTTLGGLELRQRVDEEGNLMFDDEGEALYETLDGREYLGVEEVYVKRAYPKTDENGNMLYTDSEGKSLVKTVNEDGNDVYTYEDGTVYEGDTEELTQELEEYNLGEEYKSLEGEMKDLLSEVKGENIKTEQTTVTTVTAEEALSETETNLNEDDDLIKKEKEEEIL